jgi:hypothetical protein
MDLYIYYRVRSENAPALHGLVAKMQMRLAAEHGVTGGLKRRPEEKDGSQTWMEIYQAVPSGFEKALEEAVIHDGLDALIDGQRHTEHFVDISPCA